jgi:hypothetical protein
MTKKIFCTKPGCDKWIAVGDYSFGHHKSWTIWASTLSLPLFAAECPGHNGTTSKATVADIRAVLAGMPEDAVVDLRGCSSLLVDATKAALNRDAWGGQEDWKKKGHRR